MPSYEYIQFLRENILEHLPPTFRPVGGGKYNGRCPFCGDSHKSATKRRGWLYLNKDCSYYCFNCGVSMSGMRFLQEISGRDYDDIKMDFVRLYVKNGGKLSVAQFQKDDREAGLFDLKPAVKPGWKSPLSDKAREYLEKRSVLEAPFLREPLYSTVSRSGEEYILIPWTVNGVEAYYQLNDFQKLHGMKYVFPKDSRKLVYGLDNVDVTWPYIIVFEGVYDSLFVKNAVAVGTKSVTDYQLRLMSERYPNHRICLSFDNDRPGLDAMEKAISAGKDFRFFRWFGKSTKEKDVNEFVLAGGNVEAFSNRAELEKSILSPLEMKFWMAQNGLWTGIAEKKPERGKWRREREVQRPPDLLSAMAGLTP